MVEISDSIWRDLEAKTIEDYLAPQFDPQDLPSVAKRMQVEGYNPEDVSPHALIKAERYAVVAAAFILQSDVLVVGQDEDAAFIEPLLHFTSTNDEPFATGIPGLAALAHNIRYTYSEKSWELLHDKSSRYRSLFLEYGRYLDQDTAHTVGRGKNFVRNSGGLADGVLTFFDKLQPAVDRHLQMHPAEGICKAALYHQLAPLGISRATHHLAVRPSSSEQWDQIDSDQVAIVRRGNSYTALREDEPLIRTSQLPDADTTHPTDLARPRLKCPAHAHVPSRAGTALKHAFHASINTVVAEGIV